MRTAITTLLALAAASTVQAHPHSSGCTSTAAAGPAATTDANANAKTKLLQDLQLATTDLDRARLLLLNGETLRTGDDLKEVIVFDFNDLQPASGATGGASKTADITTYPYSTGSDISMTVISLKPCGINTPHSHLRAAEMLIPINGTVRFGSVLENGLVKPGENQEIAGTLNPFQVTTFYKGSFHYQFNDGCETVMMVAALNSGNPGTSQLAQNFMSLNAGVVNATLGFPSTIGGRTIEDFRAAIPANLAQDVNSCLARCGMQ